MSMKSVLLVDEDVKLHEVLGDHLARHRIELTFRHDGEQGLEAARYGEYNLMLLGAMLPGIDGFEVLRRLRTFSSLYVMLLTTRADVADRIRGLQVGADDHLAKPFDVEELVARVCAILRREALRLPLPAGSDIPRLQRADFTIDFASRTVSYKNETLTLTNIELSLLQTFLESPGVVLTREDLVARVFQRPFHPLDRSLDMYISRLRRKLRSATPAGDHIKTIRSAGYLFSAADSSFPSAYPPLVTE
jgi:two-component system response regulator CpxR